MHDSRCLEILVRLRDFFRKYGVKYRILYAIVYGSLVNCRLTGLSDIDICVKISSSTGKTDRLEIIAELANDIEEHIGIKADVIDIELVELPLKYTVFKEGIPVYIYSRDSFVKDKWLYTLLWLDYVDAYNRMHKRVVEKIMVGKRETWNKKKNR